MGDDVAVNNVVAVAEAVAGAVTAVVAVTNVVAGAEVVDVIATAVVDVADAVATVVLSTVLVDAAFVPVGIFVLAAVVVDDSPFLGIL